MGIGVKYDDGSGSLKPLASFRGMAGTPPMKGGIGTLFRGMAGTQPIRKSLSERMRERRELGKEASKSIKLDAADPRRQGKVVGAVAHHELDADDAHRGPTEHTPWERPFMSGIHFEREAPTGRIIVWAYLRTDKFTGEGRAFETTGETKVPVFSFFDSGESASAVPRPFEIVADEEDPTIRKVVNCKIPCPVSVIQCSDYTISGLNPVYIHVDLSGSGSYTLSVNQTSRANSTTHAQFEIYEFDEDTEEIKLDARPMALPLLAT